MKAEKYAAWSWTVVALALVIFPPVGFPLVIARLLVEWKLHRFKTDLLWVPGIVTTAWGTFELILIFGIIGLSGDETLFPGLFLSLTPLGGILILAGRYALIRRDEDCALCRTIVFQGHLTEVRMIAECLDKTPEQTETLLRSMIEKGLLDNCTLKPGAEKLTVSAPWSNVLYKCPNCGAEQRLTLGITVTCAYCGAPVKAPR